MQLSRAEAAASAVTATKAKTARTLASGKVLTMEVHGGLFPAARRQHDQRDPARPVDPVLRRRARRLCGAAMPAPAWRSTPAAPRSRSRAS